MNSHKFNFSSSSSSSSDEERRSKRAMVDQEIDDFFNNVVQPNLLVLLSTITPRSRQRDPNTGDEPRPDRGREGHTRLFNDYFAEHPVYPARLFRRRFRMQRHVFLRIMEAVVENDDWFRQKTDASGRLGLSSLILAYRASADQVDEYVRISESTARLALMKFTKDVIDQFVDVHLRKPTPDDLARLLQAGEDRGFPGMIGSIDCMQWEWKNCPAAWKAQYQGRDGTATLVLEAVADRDLWIWHSFFGMPGSCNDLSVLHRSPVFQDVLEGRAPPVSFMVNGHQYDKGYYLTDGIYPKWATFIQSVTCPQTRKEKLFAQHQEAARKDVERAFGVLQSRFAIVRKPSLAWDEDDLHDIMTACIIMHNMIVEDERDTYAHYADTTEFIGNTGSADEPFEYYTDRIVDINIYLANKDQVEDRNTHLSLKSDLVTNIWKKFGRNAR